MFNAPVRGRAGDLEVALVVLGVCAVHRSLVTEWSALRSASDGIYVEIDDLSDLEGLTVIARRTDSASITNAEGPLLVA